MSMVPPVLKCIAKEQREKDGYKTFKAWIEDPKNVYIEPHIHKYVQTVVQLQRNFTNITNN